MTSNFDNILRLKNANCSDTLKPDASAYVSGMLAWYHDHMMCQTAANGPMKMITLLCQQTGPMLTDHSMFLEL